MAFYRLLADPEEGVQEQAFNVLRNLAENEDEMVFRELGAEVLMKHLETALHSSEEDVVLQVKRPPSHTQPSRPGANVGTYYPPISNRPPTS